MITVEKLLFYEKYGSSKEEFKKYSILKENGFTKKDWIVITQLINNIIIAKSRHTSKAFKNSVLKSTNNNCDNKLAIEKLYQVAE